MSKEGICEAIRALGTIKENLSREKLFIGDKPYTERFFTDEGLAEYDSLTDFIKESKESAENKGELEEKLADCEKAIAESRAVIERKLCQEQDKLYKDAMEYAKWYPEYQNKDLEKFIDFSKDYSRVLEENEHSIRNAIEKIDDTRINVNSRLVKKLTNDLYYQYLVNSKKLVNEWIRRIETSMPKSGSQEQYLGLKDAGEKAEAELRETIEKMDKRLLGYLVPIIRGVEDEEDREINKIKMIGAGVR